MARKKLPENERYKGFVPAEEPAERPWEHELEAAGRLGMAHTPVGTAKKMTDATKKLAIKHITANGWNRGMVATVLGVSGHTLDRALDTDPEFRENIDLARAAFLAKLENECVRRAYEGVEEERIGPGGVVYHIRKFSDDLLKFLMRANAPEKYSERVQVTKTVEVRHQIGFDQLPPLARLKILEALDLAAPPEEILDVEVKLLPDSPGCPQNGPEACQPPTDVP